MKDHISEGNEERLNQLNEWVTKVLCSHNFFKEEEWLPIKLNLLNWKSLGYSINQNDQLHWYDFTKTEVALLYKIINSISEILLFEKEMKYYRIKQEFDKALLYQNYQKEYTKNLKLYRELNQTILPFFSFENETLCLKFIDNYFIRQIIEERIRI